jgi:hypothetical protein
VHGEFGLVEAYRQKRRQLEPPVVLARTAAAVTVECLCAAQLLDVLSTADILNLEQEGSGTSQRGNAGSGIP